MEAKLYKNINHKVKCLACKHYCVIAEGKTGICSIRGNINGKLELFVYSRPIAVHLDPIEKKPLFHFKPGSKVYSIGTFGCNFRCAWCQNWDISQFPKQESRFDALKAKELIEQRALYLPPEEAVKQAKLFGAQGMAYTYNEPTVWVEYAKDIAEISKNEGLFNVFVSSGYESKESLDYVKDYVDAYNIDLKAFTDKAYRQYIGASLENVLETIERIHKMSKWMEITTLIVPGVNDSEQELREIARFIADIDPTIPWHISRFFPYYKFLHMPPTDIKVLEKAKKIGEKEGLKFVYVGNVWNPEWESTYCPECGEELIIREGYEITKNVLDNGHCPKCGASIAGVWD